jgi:hypothetical protein
MLKDFMQTSGSRSVLARFAEGVGLKRRPDPIIGTTRAVKKGKPFGRYIDHRQLSYRKHMYDRAIDVDMGGGTTVRRYQPVYRKVTAHSFLHATKGWRTFRGPLPFALQRVIMKAAA